MNRTEFELNKIPSEFGSKEWLESEAIVKMVVFSSGEPSAKDDWVALKAPTLDGNELWLVAKENTSSLEAKMGFKKPLNQYFMINGAQAKSLLSEGLK